MSEELRPCPFCGNAAKLNELSWYEQVDTTPYIACDCGLYFAAKTVEELVARWNARPAENALRAEVDFITRRMLDAQYLLSLVPYDAMRTIIEGAPMTIEAVQMRAFLDELVERNAQPAGDAVTSHLTNLEMFRMSVPWEGMVAVLTLADGIEKGYQLADYRLTRRAHEAIETFREWLAVHAPQEPPHES